MQCFAVDLSFSNPIIIINHKFTSMFKICKFTLLLVLLVPFLSTFSSCSDDFDPIRDLNGTRSDIMSMLQSEDIVQRANIDSDNFTFYSKMGTRVTAEPNSFVFTESGALATGMIDFEMTELFTKSEILQYGIVTQSLNSILESDGEFLFSASQNGKPLRLADDKALQIIVPNPNPKPGMELFVVGEGAWLPTENGLTISESNNQNAFSGYEFFINRLEWVNIDYFTKFEQELTDISITLPTGYEDNKISLWIVFRDLDVVLSSGGRNLPIGEVVSIICLVAEDEDTFRIDIQEVTVAEGLTVNLSPKEESEENIKKLLKDLD